jgi:Protein of unknown function (DUF4089)
MSDPIDEYIEATLAMLSVRIQDPWKPSLKTSFSGLLAMAKFVDAYRLPDDAQPANVFEVLS